VSLTVSVTVTQHQRTQPTLSRWTLSRLARAALSAEGYNGWWGLEVRFVTPAVMRRLNRAAQGHDEPTDVLSFPVQFATDRPSLISDYPRTGRKLLGSLVLAPTVAAAQATAHGRTVVSELERLAAHGLRHLLGYDHTDAGRWLPRSAPPGERATSTV
jgi:probable rRNA maturation factor